MAKKPVSFPTFRKWFKKLTKKQKTGLFAGLFALIILPIAVFAAQQEVEVGVGASGKCGAKVCRPNEYCSAKKNLKGKLVYSCKSRFGNGYCAAGLKCKSSEKCVGIYKKVNGVKSYVRSECRPRVAASTASPSATPNPSAATIIEEVVD